MNASPGWYPDPQAPGKRRYWDGVRWSSAEESTKESIMSGAFGRIMQLGMTLALSLALVVLTIGGKSAYDTFKPKDLPPSIVAGGSVEGVENVANEAKSGAQQASTNSATSNAPAGKVPANKVNPGTLNPKTSPAEPLIPKTGGSLLPDKPKKPPVKAPVNKLPPPSKPKPRKTLPPKKTAPVAPPRAPAPAPPAAQRPVAPPPIVRENVDPNSRYRAPSVAGPTSSCTRSGSNWVASVTFTLNGGVYDEDLRGGGARPHGYNGGTTTVSFTATNNLDAQTIQAGTVFVPVYKSLYTPGTFEEHKIIWGNVEIPASMCR